MDCSSLFGKYAQRTRQSCCAAMLVAFIQNALSYSPLSNFGASPWQFGIHICNQSTLEFTSTQFRPRFLGRTEFAFFWCALEFRWAFTPLRTNQTFWANKLEFHLSKPKRPGVNSPFDNVLPHKNAYDPCKVRKQDQEQHSVYTVVAESLLV